MVQEFQVVDIMTTVGFDKLVYLFIRININIVCLPAGFSVGIYQ